MGIWITEVEPAGDGPRLAVKDLFDTTGIRTTYGSAIYADHVPDTTATAVRRLEDAGYVNVGKANLHEFAWGITSENDHYGWVPNPAAPGRIAGGSSGGNAAALAAGLADAALGTDSGGSVRIPAACCGVAGFKPTYGLVPLDGCWPLAPTFDHAGPMARDVATCEAMMEALAPGFVPIEPPALGELRVGVAWTADADPLVRERVEALAARLPGARPVDLDWRTGAQYPEFQRECADVHRELFATQRERYGENVATKLGLAMAVTDEQVERAAAERAAYREHVAQAMDDLDLLLTPTIARVAPPQGIGDLAIREWILRFTYPFNATGLPALAFPCGPAEDGLPASAQLVGGPGADALVLAAGRALESVAVA
jgi:aspartyl-tRNA(Asn)/glutamyl-tRNA(Gln) amidotransferase subunit A